MRADGRWLVRVGPVEAAVAAPPGLVYQMLAAIGQGAQPTGERAEILERDGDALVCDFWTRVAVPVGRDRLVRTRERVVLRPPDRVDYEHLDGPVRGLQESIEIVAAADGTSRLVYLGRLETPDGLRWLVASILVRPTILRVMRSHFGDLATRAEARARRSRLFAVTPRI